MPTRSEKGSSSLLEREEFHGSELTLSVSGHAVTRLFGLLFEALEWSCLASID